MKLPVAPTRSIFISFRDAFYFYISLEQTQPKYFSLVSLEINGSSICTVPPSSSPSVSLYKTFEKIQIWKIVKILTALLLGQSVTQSERLNNFLF